MEAVLRSEFKKLLSVRSTYLLTLLIILLSGLFTYLGTSQTFGCQSPNASTTQNSQDIKTQAASPDCKTPTITRNLLDDKMVTNIESTVTGAAALVAIVVMLLMAHEYRYNTITYTLTLSRSRSQVIAAKLIAGAVYITFITLVAIAITVAFTYLAVNVKGLNLAHQDINWLAIVAKSLVYNLGFSLFGLALITLVRNLTAAIVMLFVVPSLDALAGVYLKSNNIEPTKLLPFSALGRVLSHANMGATPTSQASVVAAALVFAVYLVVFWIVSWYLFLRRDAT